MSLERCQFPAADHHIPIKRYIHRVFRHIWQEEHNLGYDDIPEPFDHLINYVIDIALHVADGVKPNEYHTKRLSQLLGATLDMIQETKQKQLQSVIDATKLILQNVQSCEEECTVLKRRNSALKKENDMLKQAYDTLYQECDALKQSGVKSDEHMGKRRKRSHKKCILK